MKQFNVYCDESSVTNIQNKYFVIGAFVFPRTLKTEFKDAINQVKNTYKIHSEIKWRKSSPMTEKFYKEVIDIFFKEKEATFWAIVVDKEKRNLEAFHQNDEELSFYKFYYFLLKKHLIDENEYYILIDKRPKKDKSRISSLNSFLNYEAQCRENPFHIKHIQEYDSKENVFIQISDFFTGAVNYAFNEKNKKENLFKNSLIRYIANKLGKQDLCFGSKLYDSKFNIFWIWNK